jgi:hypothetical protein
VNQKHQKVAQREGSQTSKLRDQFLISKLMVPSLHCLMSLLSITLLCLSVSLSPSCPLEFDESAIDGNLAAALTLELPKDLPRRPSERSSAQHQEGTEAEAAAAAAEEEEEALPLEDESDIFASSPRSDDDDEGGGGSEKLVGKFDGFRVKTGRISLVDFTRKASDVDRAALSRRPTALLELEAELFRAESRMEEITVQLSAEQVQAMR